MGNEITYKYPLKKEKGIFCGTLEERKKVNKEVKRAVKLARLANKNKIADKLNHGDLRSACRGIKIMSMGNANIGCKPMFNPCQWIK